MLQASLTPLTPGWVMKLAMQSALTEHTGCELAGSAPPGSLPWGAGAGGSFASTLTSNPACHKVFQLEAAHDRLSVRLALPQPPLHALSVCRAWPHGTRSTAEARLGHPAGSSLNSEFQPPALGLSANEGGWLTTRPQRTLKAQQHLDKV